MFHLLHYYIYIHIYIYICGKEQKRYVTNMSMDGLHPWVIPVRIPSHGNWWNGMAMNQNLGVLVNFLNIETAEWIAECSSPPFLEWQGSKMVVGFPANCSRRWLGSCPSWEWSSYSLFLISTYLNDWLSISPAWTCDIHSWNHTYNIYIWHVEWLYHLISPVVLLFLLRILWITSSYAWNHWFPRWNQRLSAPSKYTELGYQKVVLGLIVLPCYPHELYQSHELSHVLGETIMFFAGWIPKNCWVNFLCCLIQSPILGETIFLGVSPQ